MATTLEVYLGGRRLRISPKSAIGKGGEADVYDIGGGRALKLYKPPDHPDLALDPQARQAAALRLDEQQRKLRCFPANLPERAVGPLELATREPRGTWVVGYAMRLVRDVEPLLRYADRAFRQQGGITGNDALALLRGVHATLAALHQAGIVLGDFNDLNVLVRPDLEAFFVDLDSAQFGPFLCRAYTVRFVDPTLCDPQATSPVLARPHSADSDWYAFAVMLMQCLLFVDPYGGIYKPKDPAQRVPHAARPLRRITVFHPEVGYPRPAVPYAALPDEMLERLRLVFEQDRRGVFPLALLEGTRWTTCRACGSEHARAACPFCSGMPAARPLVVARGRVSATCVFRTDGQILAAAFQAGRLRWLSHEGGAFRREDGRVLLNGSLDPRLTVRLHGEATLLGRADRVAILRPGPAPEWLSVDAGGPGPAFDANERHVWWAAAGQLWRDGPHGPLCIGEVLAGQTFLRVGPAFGLGFYRAGGLCVAFVFDGERPGLNDAVKLPPVAGQLLDASCAFERERCWLVLAEQAGGRTVHHCALFAARGEREALARAEAGESAWLGTALRGACAAGRFLLVPTDEGIVRVEPDGSGGLHATRSFPEARPFVDSAVRLLAGPDGVYAVSGQEIRRLAIG